MSNGTNIIDQIRELSPDPNIMMVAINGFRAVPSSTDTLPLTDINQFINSLSGISIPDGAQAAEERQNQLRQLMEEGISTPEAAIEPLTEQFTQVQQLITGELRNSFASVLDPLSETFTNLSSSSSTLLSSLRTPLVPILDILVKDSRILGLQKYSEQFEQVSALIEENAQNAANFLQAQLEESMAVTTGPVQRATEGTTTALTGAISDYNSEAIVTELQILINQLSPEAGEPSLAEQIASLDLSNDTAVVALISKLESVRNLLVALGNRSVSELNLALDRFTNTSGAKLISSLEIAYNAVGNLEIENLLDFGLGVREGLESIREQLSNINTDRLLQPIRELLSQVQSTLGKISLSDLQDRAVSALNQAKTGVQDLSGLQIQLTALLHNTITSVNSTIAQVNLTGLIETVQDAINAVTPVINEIKMLFDSIDTAIDSVLNTIAGALETLTETLVDEETGVKKQLEDYLLIIQEALEGFNIQNLLTDLGEAIGNAIEKLKEVAFNPIIDTVVEELEGMRDSLAEIDTSQLNDLLREALKIALNVLVELGDRYDDQIKTALLDSYNSLVTEGVEKPFSFAQNKFNELIGEVEVLDPGFIIREAGLISLYETLQAELSNFRPSQVIGDISELDEDFRNQLDNFSPEQYLTGLVEIFQQLKAKVNTLAPSQLIEPLENLLNQLKDELQKLDLTAFTDSLRSSLLALPNIVSSISFEGMSATLNEVYQPIASAIEIINPEALLRPVLDLRQQLIDAINQADLSALEPVLRGVGGNYNQARLDGVQTQLLTLIEDTVTGLRTADPTNMIAQLRPHFSAVRTAADNLPTVPGFEARRAQIVELANDLDPFPALSSAVEKFNTLVSTINSLRQAVESLANPSASLTAATQAANSAFDQLTPQLDPALGIREAIVAIIESAFENFALDGIEESYRAVVELIGRFSPDNLLAGLQSIIDDIGNLVQNLANPEPIITALEAINQELQSALDAVSFEPLAADLDSAFTALTAQLDELDPTPLIEPISQRYNDLIGVADQIDIDEVVTRLDQIYQEQILNKLPDLHPQEILIDPLENAFKDILDLIKGLDIDVLLQPIQEQLDSLSDELEEGLDRVSQALLQALGAIPL